MKISVIMPIYKPDKELLKKIEKSLKKQDIPSSLIKVDKNLGLADSLNYGIRKSKSEIIVSLHQDCLPSSRDWLRKLVEPLKRKEVVASVSKVELPYDFWNNFDFFGKIMSVKEQRAITPLMDEKGCAYKKSALIKAGLFDSKTFRTAGEDFDMWIKLKGIGKIEYPDAKVWHYHKHTFSNRIKKELQLSEGFGVLVRIYGNKIPKSWIGFLKAIPVLGWIVFLANYPYLKMKLSSFAWIPLSLVNNLIYSIGFWTGFITKKQKI